MGFKKLKGIFFTLPTSNSSRYADDPDEKIELKEMQSLDFLSNITTLETVKITEVGSPIRSWFFNQGIELFEEFKIFI